MEEGFVLNFKNMIFNSEKPATVLYEFYLTLYEVQKDLNTLKAITRLTNLYGREIVFKSILLLETVQNLNHTNIYPLLRYMCNKLIEPSDATKPVSLEDYRDNMQKLADRGRKSGWKVRSPFDE